MPASTALKWFRSCVLALLASAPAFVSAHPQGLSSADLAAIRQTCETFRDAWLRNDSAAVMKLMTQDAVIMPHHGVRPRVGAAAIADFWWPKNSPPAKITRFEQSHDEFGGDGDFAFVRGRDTVEYEWAPAAEVRRFRNVGTTLTLLRRLESGEWKISHRMWDDPPTEDLGPVAAARRGRHY